MVNLKKEKNNCDYVWFSPCLSRIFFLILGMVEDTFQLLIQAELYANVTILKKRGRKKGQKNRQPEVAEYNAEEENDEVIEQYGTKSRPNKKKTNSLQLSLPTTFFSHQPNNFFMVPYYKKYGSVLLLDSPITDLSFDELVSMFQKIFPNLMNCELKKFLENHTTESISAILQKNIHYFSDPKFATFESEKKNIFAASVANLANELVKENFMRTCSVCGEKNNFTLVQCLKKCDGFICQSCAVCQISENGNRCIGVGCMSSYDISNFSIIEQHRIQEKAFLNLVIAKRMNEGLFVCDCNGGDDIFFEPKKESLFNGFVLCPRCNKRLCVACGLEHQEGFCALLINEALNGVKDKKNFKPCPHCSTIIEKSEGCLHVQCINCKKFFCFSCGVFFLFVCVF